MMVTEHDVTADPFEPPIHCPWCLELDMDECDWCGASSPAMIIQPSDADYGKAIAWAESGKRTVRYIEQAEWNGMLREAQGERQAEMMIEGAD